MLVLLVLILSTFLFRGMLRLLGFFVIVFELIVVSAGLVSWSPFIGFQEFLWRR